MRRKLIITMFVILLVLIAAAGWYPESAEMGAAGNCVIFGHRMSGDGRHFTGWMN